MPEEAAAPVDDAERIARAVGMAVHRKPTDAPGALVVIPALDGKAGKLAGRPGAMLFHAGGAPSPLLELHVALDGSGSAETVLPFVVRIARLQLARIRLLVPAGATHASGTPAEKYLRVLVRTMREQQVEVTGETVEGDLLEEAGRGAREGRGLVVSAATLFDRGGKAVFDAKARRSLKGVPVLVYRP